MILATVKMVLPSDKKQASLDFLRWVAEQIRCEEGCLSFDIYHDDAKDNLLLVEEVWDTQEDLDRHLQSKNYRDILLLAETAIAPPEIKFQKVEATAGLEIVKKARQIG